MNQTPEWADICVRLLQGPLYNEKGGGNSWDKLIIWQAKITEYFAVLGLQLIIDPSDGYAFLSQDEAEDANGQSLPKLIKKNPLTFETSLLCVILREALENFDSSQIESPVLIMTAAEIREQLAAFYKDRADETKLYSDLATHLSRGEELGFLKRLPERDNSQEIEYEVRRIIRAKINMEFITEFKEKLERHCDTE
ncbi:MAG: DUF4194 domain-containing protein [Spirochaetaceae bacterium]|jgi:hypothetical protein|nr:DUF4194 domain-containing protein [Spirochaetaceae bacterium]